ncbi:MAG TPA: hypothetical protein VHU87_03985 [Rhizomicrobium sp.]|jgi:hypothetical protein|nr:hypothetical protein [Rhizomicrobium sp.]
MDNFNDLIVDNAVENFVTIPPDHFYADRSCDAERFPEFRHFVVRHQAGLPGLGNRRALIVSHNVNALAPRFDLARSFSKLLLILGRQRTYTFQNKVDLFLCRGAIVPE